MRLFEYFFNTVLLKLRDYKWSTVQQNVCLGRPRERLYKLVDDLSQRCDVATFKWNSALGSSWMTLNSIK